MKQTVVENAREVCGSVIVGGKNPKKAAWEILEARNKDVWKLTKKKRKVKSCIYESKKDLERK